MWPVPTKAGCCSTAAPGACWSFPSSATRPSSATHLVPGCLAFWEAIAKRKEPPRDPARDLYVPAGEALDQWSVLAGEYRHLSREKARLDALLKERKADLDSVEGKLIAMMGGFLTAEAAGLKVTRFQQSGSIDYAKALTALLPDLDATALERYRRKAAERVRVTALDEETATVAFDGQAVDAAWKQAASESFFF